MSSETASQARPEIALIGSLRPSLVEALGREFVVHHVYAEPDPLGALDALGGRIRGAVGHGMAGLTRAHLDRLPRLEIFAINGVGLETTDLAACRARGVVVTTTPVLFDDVADLAMALALAVCRKIVQADQFVRSGQWKTERFALGRKLTGMRAGIIGLGRIGREVARRLEGFKTRIAYVDPVARDERYRLVADARTLAAESDILFLCAAGGPKSAGKPLVGRDILDALGPRGVFINITRGWLVDEPELVAALRDGRLGGAGLDVFHDEPNVPPELFELGNVVLTPHIASSTEETMGAMGETVVGNLVSWFAGKGALTPVAPG
jgi:lactate dehydrogenase-like 2-hydroxyacid dehydrogenase